MTQLRNLSIVSLLAIGFALPAFGQVADLTGPQQEPSAPAGQDAGQQGQSPARDTVVITGSRVATGADAPTPVTAVTEDAINQVALPNVADALVQLPALRSTVTSAKGGQGATVIGASLNLRNLGSVRTLVLVDGKRFVPTAPFAASNNFAVNTDSVPQGLIKQVDTVTGGASAAYGSDAVAGVVNFILDKDFEGLKGEISYGQSDRSDGRRYTASLNGGAGFDDGRGHILMSLEYGRDEGIQNDPLGLDAARPFQDAANTIGLETVGGQQYIVHNATFPNFPLNGLVLGCVQNGVQKTGAACPVYATSFNDAGTATQAYNFGVRNSAASSLFADGGDGYRPGPQSLLATPTIRTLAFARADYDVSDKLNVYVEAELARTKSRSEAGNGTGTFVSGSALGFTVSNTYAFLPADLKAQMDAAGVTAINVQKYFPFNVKQTFESRTSRYVAGATYNFDSNWSGEIYYTYGEVNSQMTLDDFSDTIAMYNALTAVKDPVTGAITCAQGGQYCVPWNIFGREELPDNVRKYINPTNYYFNENTQQAVEATVKGALFSLPAGDLDVAAGAGYRKETVNESADALGLAAKTNPFKNAPGALIYINSPAITGDLELYEYFGEAQVPVLSHLPFVDSLDLNLAARYTNYSSSGGVTTWKAGMVWAPFDGLRIRAARSRDIRAANLIELFSPESTTFGTVRDPQKNFINVSIVPITSGNPDLAPEEADTTTIGFVWSPSFLPAFTATVDYFDIQIANGISTINAQRTMDLCQLGQAIYCSRIDRNANGDLTTIRTPYSNLATSENRGLDVELGYIQDLDFLGLAGKLALRAFGTYVYENSTTTPGNPPSVQDQAPGAGQLQALMTASYLTGPWTFGLQEHFVGPGQFDPTRPRYVGDRSPGQWWTDLSVKRELGKFEVFGSVQNLFDKDPPNYPFLNTSSGFGTSNIFDTQGRRYMVGVRFTS